VSLSNALLFRQNLGTCCASERACEWLKTLLVRIPPGIPRLKFSLTNANLLAIKFVLGRLHNNN